jgi:hypothetical protein
VAARWPEPAVQQRIAGDRTRLAPSDHWRTALALARGKTAQAHEAPTCSRPRALPGIGTIFARVWWHAIHDLHRAPRVQAVVSSGRRVNGANASAGTRDGPSGTKIGKASRTGALSAAAVRC